MKKVSKRIIFLFIFLMGTGPFLFSQNLYKDSKLNTVALSSSSLDQIRICKWERGANTCLNLSFDDNCKSHRKISLILDDYGFKGTFFVVSSYMLINDLKDILLRGHEIGDHTYSHPNLTALDSSHVEYEIVKAKEDIEKTFGIKCSSFATPFHKTNPLINKIAFSHQLFIRNTPEYQKMKRVRINLASKLRISDFSASLSASIKSGSMLLLAGHGIDGNGWDPISSVLLKQTLDTIKKHSDKGEVWVTTLKEGAQYENMVQEMKLEEHLLDDTLVIKCNGYLKDKYKNMEQSLISIEIPKPINDSIRYLGKDYLLTKRGPSDIITIDLKKTNVIRAYLPKRIKTDTINNNTNSISVFPNPASSFIDISSSFPIEKTEVYNLSGELKLVQNGDVRKLNTSELQPGIYILKVITSKKVSSCRLLICR